MVTDQLALKKKHSYSNTISNISDSSASNPTQKDRLETDPPPMDSLTVNQSETEPDAYGHRTRENDSYSQPGDNDSEGSMTTRKITAGIAASALLLSGIGIGTAQAADETPTNISDVTWQGPTSGSVQGGDTLQFPYLTGEGFVDASMQGNHTLAFDKEGNIWAWGASANNVLGIPGAGTTVPNPTKSDTQWLDGFGGALGVYAGGNFSLALAQVNGEDNPIGWGGITGFSDTPGNISFDLPVYFTTLDAGADHGIGIGTALSASDPDVFTWGDNSRGQLGNGSRTAPTGNANESILVRVTVGEGAPLDSSLVAAGDDFSIAQDLNGGLWTWGKNIHVASMNAPTSDNLVPVKVDEEQKYDFTAISAGGSHALALDSSGNIWAWGSNASGQLGLADEHQGEPTRLNIPGAPAGGFTKIAAGQSHSTAVDAEGNVWAWGSNAYGQLGNGSIGSSSNVPTKLSAEIFPEGTKFVSTAASENGSIFISEAGVVWGVGSNASGQLGNGKTSGTETTPVPATLPSLQETVRVYFGADDTNPQEVTVAPETRTLNVTTPQHLSGPVEVFLQTGNGEKVSQGTFTFTSTIDLMAIPSETNTGGEITLNAVVASNDQDLISPDATIDFAVNNPVTGTGSITNVAIENGYASVTITSDEEVVDSVATAELKQSGITISNTAQTNVTFEAQNPVCGPDASALAVEATVTSEGDVVMANGTDEYTATVTVVDDNDQPIPAIKVEFTAPENVNIIGEAIQTTDAAGKASVKLTSTTAGTHSIAASLPDYAGCALGNSPADVTFTSTAAVAENSDYTVSTGEKTVAAVGTEPTAAGNYHTVDITLRNIANQPVTGLSAQQLADSLSLQADPSQRLAFSEITEIGNGIYQAKVWTEVAGTKNITVSLDETELGLSTDGNNEAIFVAGQPATGTCEEGEECKLSSLTVASETAIADGNTSLWAEVKVVDEFENSISGIEVNFQTDSKLTETPAGNGVITSDENGIARISYTSITAGKFPVSATIGGETVAHSPQDIEFVAGTAEPIYNVEEAAVTVGNPDSEGRQITVTSKDANGNAVAVNVNDLAAKGAENLVFSDFTQTAPGIYQAKVTSTKAGIFPVTVELDGEALTLSGNGQVTFTAGAPDFNNEKTRIYGQTGAATANGTDSRIVTAEIYDSFDNPVANANVTFDHENDKLTPQESTVATNELGVATTEYTTTTADIYLVSGRIGTDAIIHGDPGTNPASASIEFVAGPADAANSSFAVSPNSAIAGSGQTVELTVTLKDAHGNLVLNHVSPALQATATPAAGVTLGGNEFTNNGDGTYTLPISSTTTGDKTIAVNLSTASIGHGTDNNIAKFVAGPVDLSKSSYSVTNTENVVANGVDTQIATAVLRDSYENVVTGEASNLTGSATPSGPVFAGETGEFTDNGMGTYTSDITSTKAATFTIDVAYDGQAMTASPTNADQTTFVPGDPFFGPCEDGEECALTALTVDSNPAVANDQATVWAQVLVVDANGNVIPNMDVTFAVDNGPTVSPAATVKSDDNGIAHVIYTSTVAGTFDVSATVGNTAAVDSPQAIHFTAGEGEPQYSVSTTAGVVADGQQAQTVTVVAQDESGNGIELNVANLVPEASGNESAAVSFSPFVVVDAEKGIYQANVTSTKSGTFHITVSYDGDPVSSGGNEDATFIAAAPTAANSTYTVSETADMYANGTDRQTATVTLRDANDNLAEMPNGWVLRGAATGNVTVGTFDEGENASTYVAVITATLGGTYPVTVALEDGVGSANVTLTGNGDAVFLATASEKPEVQTPTEKEVSGTGTPGAEITVTGPEGNLCKDEPIIVDENGNWTCNFTNPQEPGTDINVNQKEDGKNPSEDVTVTVPERQTSEKPEVQTPTEKEVSGTGTPGAEITVTGPEGNLCKDEPIIVDENGNWTCNFTNPQEPGTDINVNQKEEGKNPSEDVTVTVPKESWKLKVNRYAGENRYGTSGKLNQAFPNQGGTLFIATGELFPDALTISPAVVKESGSLILVRRGIIPTETVNAIKDQRPSKVYIVGGNQAVSPAVVNNLKALVPAGTSIERVKGEDRYETSKAVFNKFFAEDGTDRVFVATGLEYPDSLSASAIAGRLGNPVLLVRGNSASNLPQNTISSMQKAGVNNVIVTGGTVAINKNIFTNLGKTFSTERIGGATRYETNANLNQYLTKVQPDTVTTGVWLATGVDFPDALSASVFAAQPGQRLYLSRISCIPGDIISKIVYAAGTQVRNVNLVGGTAVLDKSVFGLTTCK